MCTQARVLCNGLIESLGRVEFDGKITHPFTAHPKVDGTTGGSLLIPGLLLQCMRLHTARVNQVGRLPAFVRRLKLVTVAIR